MEKISVIIAPNGEVQVSVSGVFGNECLNLTDFLKKHQVQRQSLSGEYYLKKEPIMLKIPEGKAGPPDDAVG